MSDYEYELQMALMNRKLDESIETIFMLPGEMYNFLSSRLVKEVASLGGSVEGLMPPHIIAGVNLSFWPMGWIFRRAGAFFIRRTFRGDGLYSAVFTEYLFKLLREGFSVEFFIEGTRSRTGKVLMSRGAEIT